MRGHLVTMSDPRGSPCLFRAKRGLYSGLDRDLYGFLRVSKISFLGRHKNSGSLDWCKCIRHTRTTNLQFSWTRLTMLVNVRVTWKRRSSSLPPTGLSWVYEPYPTISPYFLGDSYWLRTPMVFVQPHLPGGPNLRDQKWSHLLLGSRLSVLSLIVTVASRGLFTGIL